MEESSKVYVGLDVHKDSIAIGAAEPGRAPGRVIGKIAHDVSKLLKMLAKLGQPGQLHVVYEAGPTGYGLQRALQARGYVCEVIAPSQMPRRPGDRVKTDGRDCVQLAECSRAGPAARGVGSRSCGRGDPGPGARARRRGQQPHPGAPPAQGIPAAPRRALRAARPPGPRRTAAGWRALNFDAQAGADGVHRVLAGRAGGRRARAAADPGAARLRSPAGASSRWSRRCRRCAASMWSAPSGWWPRSAISAASIIRASSWATSGWSLRSTPAASASAAAASPRPATPTPAGC